ncbi:TPA: Clp protease ClpP, partial [Pseudomonas aeruginosa]|nr:Clp protease ClpP [Pseudomonas aeruginosa]
MHPALGQDGFTAVARRTGDLVGFQEGICPPLVDGFAPADPGLGVHLLHDVVDIDAGALRAIGGDVDVTVNINSPGGDVFEGLAIYNLLREHKGKVSVNIIGLAASAASFIAMAGDEIRIGRAAFLMIHNAWLIAMGNRNDLREIADWLEPFDMTLADI